MSQVFYFGQTLSVIQFGDNPELDTYVQTVNGKPVFTSRRTVGVHITHIDSQKVEEAISDLDERSQKDRSIKRKFDTFWLVNPEHRGIVIEGISESLVKDLDFCLKQTDGNNFAIYHDGLVQLDLRHFKTVRINSIENVLVS